MIFLKDLWSAIKLMSLKDAFWFAIVFLSRIPMASIVFTIDRSYESIMILWAWSFLCIHSLIYYSEKLVVFLEKLENSKVGKLSKRNKKKNQAVDYLSNHEKKIFFKLRVLAVEFTLSAVGVSPVACFVSSVYKVRFGFFIIWAGVLVKMLWLTKFIEILLRALAEVF